MKLALINGSPKPKDSTSGLLCDALSALLPNLEPITVFLRKPALDAQTLSLLDSCDALVFVFPLYVDGIPGHLLSCLAALEQHRAETGRSGGAVYGVVNCGFYEARQNTLALEMLRHFCLHAGYDWKQGVGIGGGGMLSAVSGTPMGHGVKKDIGAALKTLCRNILAKKGGELLYASPNFPRFAYKMAAQRGWRAQLKQNGCSSRDLFHREV
ncbi:MAG: hypothetical protein ACOX6U_00440 [Oscillospiraceae bacterium]|jgi:hypothetical protein